MNSYKSFDEAAVAQAKEIAELVISKNADYGSQNIMNCPFGVEVGIVVRLYDKLARFSNLTKSSKAPSHESLMDTVNDIIGYGLVLKMVMNGTFLLPLSSEITNEDKSLSNEPRQLK